MFTTNQFKKRMAVDRLSQGQYRICVVYRGKVYFCISNNSLAWDRLENDNYPSNYPVNGYTNRGAWQAFYDECLQKNFLGKWQYQKSTDKILKE